MNSRLRTIIFLISITTIFAFVLLLQMVTIAEAGDKVDVPPPTTISSEADPQAASPQAPNAFILDIIINGGGSVTTEPVSYTDLDVITLTAVADLGWQFSDFSGDLITANSPVTITLDNNYNITANFNQRCYLLSLNHTGTGSNPTAAPTNSVGCAAGYYHYQEAITLTAAAAANWQVASWSGTQNDISTANSNTVIMPASAHPAGVTYTPICYTLTVAASPTAGGTAQATTAPNCPGDISGTKYLQGTPVGLQATNALGYAFTNWSGSIAGSVNPTTITMNVNRSVTANFNKSCHPLSTTHSPPGSGSNPAAAPPKSNSCVNTGEYVAGEVIDLTAQPIAGWRVNSWIDTDDDGSSSNNNTLTFPALANGVGYGVGVNYLQLPTLKFKQASYQVLETGVMATIQVERIGSSSESVDVWYATSDDTAKLGQDYKNASGRLTFGSGVLSQSFDVEIMDDKTKEGTETLNLTLSDVSSNAVLGTPATAELEILDDEGDLTIQFQTTTYQAQEISPTLPITVTMFPKSTKNVYVDFRTQAGTATSGEDYTEIPPRTLRFEPGQTEVRVNITLKNDELDEPDETVQLHLFNNDGAILGESQAIMTIIDDDDTPTLQFSDSEYFAKEGDLTTPVSVTLNAASAYSIKVYYDVIKVSVGRQLAGNLIFAPGEVNKTIDVPVGGYQVDDTLNIILSDAENATLGSPSSTSLTILDKDRSECHQLTMDNTGYGKLPITTNMKKSVGCAVGEFVADELIFVSAQPDPGWDVDGWFGTLDNGLKNDENIVRMPDSDHVVNVFYITSRYMPTVSNMYITYFEGSQEVEPNDALMEANGPIRSGMDYFGGFNSTNDSYDSFFFTLPSKGNVQIQLVDIPIGRDYNLYLLSSDLDLTGYSGSLNNADEHISVGGLEKGLYYVSVHFAQGKTSTAKYRLNVIYD